MKELNLSMTNFTEAECRKYFMEEGKNFEDFRLIGKSKYGPCFKEKLSALDFLFFPITALILVLILTVSGKYSLLLLPMLFWGTYVNCKMTTAIYLTRESGLLYSE